MADPQIIVNQLSGTTGHVNVTFKDSSGNVLGTFGANIAAGDNPLNGFDGGVYLESNAGRTVVSQSVISVTTEQFNNAYGYAVNMANATAQGRSDYDLMCGNCVDFAGSVLERIGQSRHNIGNYLTDGSLLDIYARSVMYLCSGDIDSMMWAGGNDAVQIPGYIYGFTPTYSSAWGNLLNGTDSAFMFGVYEDVKRMLNGSLFALTIFDLSQTYGAEGSPIAIDLNGDGVQTYSGNVANVKFDVTGDGVIERTGWLDKNDGFVAFDRNGNGVIDNVNELFGGTERGVGYQELGVFDSNKDGVVNGLDADFGRLSIWQDANTNGATDAGELVSLLEKGVSEISLQYVSRNEINNGNNIAEHSRAIVNGKESDAGDVYFRFMSDAQYDKLHSSLTNLIDAMAGFSSPAVSSTSAATVEKAYEPYPTLAIATN